MGRTEMWIFRKEVEDYCYFQPEKNHPGPDFRFLHTEGYFIPEGKKCFRPTEFGIWVWVVKVEDLCDFYWAYEDVDWVMVRPRRHSKVIAFPHSLPGGAEDYVMGRIDSQPIGEPFNPSKHCLGQEKYWQGCWCGCDQGEWSYRLTTPYAVWIEGPFLRRVSSGIKKAKKRYRSYHRV